MEKEVITTLEELECKAIKQAFTTGSEAYLEMVDGKIYMFESENLRLTNAASNKRICDHHHIIKVKMEKHESLKQVRVIIECASSYMVILIYEIEDLSVDTIITVKETPFTITDFEVSTLKYEAEEVSRDLNSKLIGENVKKVLKSDLWDSAIIVTEHNTLRIKNSGEPETKIKFELDKLEGRTIAHVECAIASIESVLLRVYANNLSVGPAEPIGTIEITKPNPSRLYLEVEEKDMYQISNYGYNFSFSDLVGQTIIDIERDEDDEELVFTMDGGYKFTLYHIQDCCEHVYLSDICGNLEDLMGTPLLQAEETTHDASDEEETTDNSATWTFYKLATIKGVVTLRWVGQSNGYYSESVDIAISHINNQNDTDKKVYLQ